MIRKAVLLATIATIALAPSAYAAGPVYCVNCGTEATAALQLGKEAITAENVVQQLATLRAQYQQIIGIYGSLAHGVDVNSMAQGLLSPGVRMPFSSITNLPSQIMGQTAGTGLASQFQAQNTYYTPQGSDFMANWMNARSAGTANAQALSYQYMQSAQDRMSNLQALQDEAQSAPDVTQLAGIQTRIGVEQQYLTSAQQQAQQVAQLAAVQDKAADLQIMQKQRQDAELQAQQTQAAADALGVTGFGQGGSDANAPVLSAARPADVPVFGYPGS